MSAYLAINKILDKKDFSFVENNHLSEEYFVGYEEEYNFIESHYFSYKKIPDKFTFVSQFPEFNILEVSESDSYLYDSMIQDYIFSKINQSIMKAGEMEDAISAKDMMINALQEIKLPGNKQGVDIVHEISERVSAFEEVSKGQSNHFIPTGFIELDDVLSGWKKGEELAIIFARTGQGKSWVLTKSLLTAWKTGHNVGFISPEMTANQLGYRFDTLNANFSNKGLFFGDTSAVDLEEYKDYAEKLKTSDKKFIVSTPLDFNGPLTVSKLRSFVKDNQLDILGIDGIAYMHDERGGRRDATHEKLKHICEDLMLLSVELSIPILAVVQANREGAGNEEGPELTNLSGSDDIGRNASRVISIVQSDRDGEKQLKITIKKNRYGKENVCVMYAWDTDLGVFNQIATKGFVPTAPSPYNFGNSNIVF